MHVCTHVTKGWKALPGSMQGLPLDPPTAGETLVDNDDLQGHVHPIVSTQPKAIPKPDRCSLDQVEIDIDSDSTPSSFDIQDHKVINSDYVETVGSFNRCCS